MLSFEPKRHGQKISGEFVKHPLHVKSKQYKRGWKSIQGFQRQKGRKRSKLEGLVPTWKRYPHQKERSQVDGAIERPPCLVWKGSRWLSAGESDQDRSHCERMVPTWNWYPNKRQLIALLQNLFHIIPSFKAGRLIIKTKNPARESGIQPLQEREFESALEKQDRSANQSLLQSLQWVHTKYHCTKYYIAHWV